MNPLPPDLILLLEAMDAGALFVTAGNIISIFMPGIMNPSYC